MPCPGNLPAVTPATAQPTLLRPLFDAYAERPEPRSVAVVGNMPMTPDAARAKAIDDCDLVFRVNGFVLDEPTGPAVVGRHCHVVVLNWLIRATKWVFQDYQHRLYLMVEPGRLHFDGERVPGWWPADLGYIPVSNRDVTLPLSDALGLPTRAEPTWATTGTMAAWIARTAFPDAELILTGFSFIDDPNQKSWMHAAGDSCVVGAEHKIDIEGRLLESWTRTSRTRLLR